MTDRPHVICRMIISLDGRIQPGRWTDSPDGERGDWSRLYEQGHDRLDGDAWLVGRVTMAEMSTAPSHPRPTPRAGRTSGDHHGTARTRNQRP